jgi:hypothetical protein
MDSKNQAEVSFWGKTAASGEAAELDNLFQWSMIKLNFQWSFLEN